jgi:hypothetical protein
MPNVPMPNATDVEQVAPGRRSRSSQPHNQGFDQWLVGFAGTTDVVFYPSSLAEADAPEQMRKALQYWIVEAKESGEPKKVRPYDPEYREQIEEDIAKASISYDQAASRGQVPFLSDGRMDPPTLSQ